MDLLDCLNCFFKDHQYVPWLAILGIPSALFAYFTYFHSLRRSRKREMEQAYRETYLTLELAANDVFRFEADHPELVRQIFEKGAVLPAEEAAERVILLDYVCQILNLFELATRFRCEQIVPKDIFESWVAWMYQIWTAPGFITLWPTIRHDYTEGLQKIMDFRAGEGPDVEKRFYKHVRHVIDCSAVDD